MAKKQIKEQISEQGEEYLSGKSQTANLVFVSIITSLAPFISHTFGFSLAKTMVTMACVLPGLAALSRFSGHWKDLKAKIVPTFYASLVTSCVVLMATLGADRFNGSKADTEALLAPIVGVSTNTPEIQAERPK